MMSSSAHRSSTSAQNRRFTVWLAAILAVIAVVLEVGLFFAQGDIGPFAPLVGLVAIVAGLGILFVPIVLHLRK